MSTSPPVSPTVHVFVGPTLPADEVRRIRPDACVHPPVAHGDLLAAPVRRGDVVLVVDGLYHQCAPVRHKELLALVDRGVSVVGCSSMGALRAAELVGCGMLGHGAVFEMYRDGLIDADDEVAVVHSRTGDVATRNTPLVAVRWLSASAAAAGAIGAEQAEQLVEAARRLHYTERSWRMLALVAAREGSGLDDVVTAVLAHAERHPEDANVKHRDAVDTLTRLDELVAGGDDGPPAVPTASWRNPHAFAWAVEHTRSAADGVGDGELLRHAQLYDPELPARYRTFVLAQLEPTATPQQIAARWAARLPRQRHDADPLLTPDECTDLDDDEAALRMLVRAYSSPRLASDLLAHLRAVGADPTADVEARERTAAARRINDETWWRGRERLVQRLPERALLRHLAGLWGVAPRPAPDRVTLAAAARDRGFADLADAVRAVRPHFLRDDAAAGGNAVARWRSA